MLTLEERYNLPRHHRHYVMRGGLVENLILEEQKSIELLKQNEYRIQKALNKTNLGVDDFIKYITGGRNSGEIKFIIDTQEEKKSLEDHIKLFIKLKSF